MNALKNLKGIITIFFFIISSIFTLIVYSLSLLEYPGKGNELSHIISSNAVIVILYFAALGIFFSCIAFWLRRKNRAVLYISIALLILNMYKIIEVILVLNKVEKGIFLIR